MCDVCVYSIIIMFGNLGLTDEVILPSRLFS